MPPPLVWPCNAFKWDSAIYVCIYMYVHVHIYIERERETLRTPIVRWLGILPPLSFKKSDMPQGQVFIRGKGAPLLVHWNVFFLVLVN